MKSMVMRSGIAPGQSVAVIGSGISGLASAWFLGQKHRVTLFEKNTRLGGHTNTCSVQLEGVEQPVDTGFIVYNRPNYPHLNAMFKHLKVPIENTEMSFSVSVDQGRIEYSGNNLNTLFAQRRNLLSVAHWKMLAEILRFNRQAKKDLFNGQLHTLNLESYLRMHHFSQRMRDYYLLPMAAAIWSCPVKTMMAFPAESFLRFFENHGLLNIQDRPQWETVKGGAQNYIDALMHKAKFSVAYDPVRGVAKSADGLKVTTENGEALFDHVVFAAHGDQNWQLFDSALQQTFTCMQAFNYQQNTAYLHSDPRLMPRRKKAWASWNYLRESCSEERHVAVTYWMNQLQNIPLKTPLLVTLNPLQEPEARMTYECIQYQHPVFDQGAMEAQKSLSGLQGVENCWFVGAYTGYGFHEDGLRSAVDLARRWNVSLPWENRRAEV
ncbi:NAD(P)/FAD-dependent oxidoreductase [Thiomicrorhabdus sp. 6S3-12]|uniref:NAD(P)/FAD-dependent oxidoreductase n=1 Tax=Thiomicrorhabdus sp. 6S3-12 TaxID=2819681 RepID=UPI001FB7A693|nr:FAD-dependent oxidoreductase [Thiomicrorhabdus sp. 6S3-12]